jgi:hypothetical protein
MRRVALLGIVGALSVGAAHAQSNASAQPQVTQAVTVVAQREPAVTVVAQREPVVTVLAPRETASGTAAAKRPQTPSGIGTAVDADGDGIADAKGPATRGSRTGRASGKRTATATATASSTAGCTKDERGAAEPACASAKQNPVYEDKATQGQNPLHEP